MADVSVLMPVRIRHAQEIDWLREAVRSIKAQTYRALELILVDDGSESGAVQAAVADVWDTRFRLFRTAGAGTSAARNLAAAKAAAPLILPVDADDKLAPDTVERYMAAWTDQSGFLYPTVHIFDDAGTDIPTAPQAYDFDKLLQVSYLLVGNLHRKADWERVHGWNVEFQAGYEDWDYWIRLGEIGVCGTPCPEAAYYYRRNPHGRIAALRNDPLRAQGAMDKLHVTHRALYQGVRPMACCGGRRNGGGAAGARSAPMGTQAAVVPELPGAQRGLVLIEYVGGNYGLTEWHGATTGNRHVFSADPANRFGWVDPADLETGDRRKPGFLDLRENARAVFQLAPQPSTQTTSAAQPKAEQVEEVQIPVAADSMQSIADAPMGLPVESEPDKTLEKTLEPMADTPAEAPASSAASSAAPRRPRKSKTA